MPSNFNPTRVSIKGCCDFCNKDDNKTKLQLALRLGFVIAVCARCEGDLLAFLLNAHLLRKQLLKSTDKKVSDKAREGFVGPIVKSQALQYAEKKAKEINANAGI